MCKTVKPKECCLIIITLCLPRISHWPFSYRDFTLCSLPCSEWLFSVMFVHLSFSVDRLRCWPFPNILSGMIISPLSLLQMTWPTAMIPLTVYLPKPFKSVFPFKNWTLDHWPVYAALYWTDLFGGPICTRNMTNGKSDTPILFPSYLLSLNFISLI